MSTKKQVFGPLCDEEVDYEKAKINGTNVSETCLSYQP